MAPPSGSRLGSGSGSGSGFNPVPIPASNPATLLTSAASLCALPTELVLSIIADFAPADLNALARTNRGFHDTLNPVLYQQTVRQQQEQGTSRALTWACEHGRAATLPHLRAQGADFNGDAAAPPGWFGGLPSRASPLHLAARHGRVDVLAWLLDADGADIDTLSLDFCCCRPVAACLAAPTPTWTPLHTAVCHGHARAALFLLARGASLVVSPRREPCGREAAVGGREGRRTAITEITVLHSAAAADNVVLVDNLLAYRPALANAVDSRGYTPLHYAARRARAGHAIPRLAEVATPWPADCPFPPSPLMTALLTGAFGSARLLHRAGGTAAGMDDDALLGLTLAATAPRSTWDSTPKEWAAQREAFLLHLLSRGASPTCPVGATSPLHRLAAQPPRLTTPAVFSALLAAGAEADAPDGAGGSALYVLAGQLRGLAARYPWEIPEGVYESFAGKVAVLQRGGARVLAPAGGEGEKEGFRTLGRFIGVGEGYKEGGKGMPPWRRKLLVEVLRRAQEVELDWWAGYVLERWARVVVTYARWGRKMGQEKKPGG